VRWTSSERRILRRLDEIEDLIRKEQQDMDAAGEALKASIEGLQTEENETHAAVAAAGTKFTELKEKLEHVVTTGALSDEEAAALTALANGVATNLTEATDTLKADTAAA
jgi:hypothetical protein